MDLKEIKSVIDLMTKNGLSEFELEKGDFKLRVKRGPGGEWTSTTTSVAAPQVVHHHAPVAAFAPVPPWLRPSLLRRPAQPGFHDAETTALVIPSPMVGTF